MWNPIIASTIAGYLSIVCWIIVFSPQLYENYTRKSGEGLSMTFLVIWLAGDIFNLVGVIMQNLLATMFLLALWYTVADIGLIWQVLYYRRAGRNHGTCGDDEEILTDETNPLLSPPQHSRHSDSQDNNSERSSKGSSVLTLTQPFTMKHIDRSEGSMTNWVFFGFITAVTLASCYAYITTPPIDSINTLPQVCGWTSAILYIGSRIPQIVKNWRNKSTEGLSIFMFLCAVLGNTFFTMSIFFRSVETHYILMNLSWILGSCGTLVFDAIIFAQFFIYNREKINNID